MRINRLRATALIALALLLPLKGVAQESVLKLTDIMAGYDWVGNLPDRMQWYNQSDYLFFNWNPDNEASESIYRYDFRSGELVKTDAEMRSDLTPRGAVFNSDQSRMLLVRGGNIFLHERGRRGRETVTQLTNTLESVGSPRFTGDEKGVTFMVGNNIFKIDLETGLISQLTDFRQGSPSSPSPSSPLSDQDRWLRRQQSDLFEYYKAREERQALMRAQQRAQAAARPAAPAEEDDSQRPPRTVWLGEEGGANFSICPNLRFVTYNTYKRSGGGRRTIVPNYITQSGYTDSFNARAKVGTPMTEVGLSIYDTERRTTYRVNTSDIPGIRDVPLFKYEYGFQGDQYEEDRAVNISQARWSSDGSYAVVQISSHDNKDRWIMLLDAETGDLSLIDRQRDEAWIAGPGINAGTIGWMPDNRRVWFQSEESGYSHLYTVDVVTGEKVALTSGNFEVYGPRISNDNRWWYFSSNEVHPGERHFYRMPLNGGERTQITSMTGHNNVSMSPDESKLAIRFSYSNRPWEIYVMDNRPGAEAKRITESPSEEFMAYPWRDPEVITFPAEDGADVWARLYRPEAAVNNGAAVIFVHGAGYLQNVHKWWSQYFREYMFHNKLVDMGYTVLDIDFRASSGYGRDWRTGIYRHMGGLDLSDHVDGARFLVEEHGVDPQRIGIYGGSYGGFITLMAMFNHPDVFAAGAALRSVTDWAHYNHGYTSNILNTPVQDSIAFQRSSPINFADGLEGALLMCHGIIDDNVQFQDIIRLSQRLIELGKENWELAVYPVERHAFTETSSWVDEYRRILLLFENNLR